MKPNLQFPLAPSYNPRGVAAYTNVAKDQRKLNAYYEVAQSALGKTTIYLSKRPGVSVNAGTFGANTQVQWLCTTAPTKFALNNPWLIVKDGNAIKGVSDSTATTILSSADHNPAYIDHANVGGTDTVVVQLVNNTTISAAQRVYYSSSIGTWTEITDGDFTGIAHRGKAEFMDGYMFILGADNRIYQSNLNSLANWTAGDYITRSMSMDNPLGLARLRNQLLALGEECCEVFYNNGNASGSVLRRSPELHRNIGLGQISVPQTGVGRTHYYTTIGERIYILARSPYGGFVNQLWTYNGGTFEKVSSSHEDKMLSQGGVYSINKVNFAGQQAVAIQLTVPSATTQKWLMFFPDTKSWFEWESAKYGPVNNGYWFLGCTSTDKIYNFPQSDVYQDDSTDYEFQTAFAIPGTTDDYLSMSYCGVTGDTTASAASLQVSFKDNDFSFGSARVIDMASAKKRLERCGIFKHRQVKLSYTGSQGVRLEQFYARVE